MDGGCAVAEAAVLQYLATGMLGENMGVANGSSSHMLERELNRIHAHLNQQPYGVKRPNRPK